MSILAKRGIPPELCWPYDSIAGKGVFSERKTAEMSAPFKIKSYASLDCKNIEEVRMALVNMGPFPVAVAVFSPEWKAPKDIIHLPKEDSWMPGYHAVCLVGYDDYSRSLEFMNSWGQDWGDEGFGWMSYDYLGEHGVTAWVAYDAANIRSWLDSIKVALSQFGSWWRGLYAKLGDRK